MKKIAILAAVFALAGCATTTYTPMERHLNRYAGAETIARQCPAYGGYGSVASMREDAQSNLQQAKALGATEADVAKARDRVSGQMMAATILVGQPAACNSMLNELAWHGDQPAS